MRNFKVFILKRRPKNTLASRPVSFGKVATLAHETCKRTGEWIELRPRNCELQVRPFLL